MYLGAHHHDSRPRCLTGAFRTHSDFVSLLLTLRGLPVWISEYWIPEHAPLLAFVIRWNFHGDISWMFPTRRLCYFQELYLLYSAWKEKEWINLLSGSSPFYFLFDSSLMPEHLLGCFLLPKSLSHWLPTILLYRRRSIIEKRMHNCSYR